MSLYSQKNPWVLIVIFIVVLAGSAYVLMVLRSRVYVEQGSSTTPISTQTNQDFVTYQDSEYGVQFGYPKSWGTLAVNPGNTQCPEEDTYRTPDTLHIFDRELRFQDTHLPNSESIIRSGVHFYRLDPAKSNGCNDDVLRRLARREITGAEFSSFQLFPAEFTGFFGVRNPQASRLSTEGREQYTFFIKDPKNSSFVVVQPYASFIPFADSPEWKEIEGRFGGNMVSYLESGTSSKPIRLFLSEFRDTAESIQILKK